MALVISDAKILIYRLKPSHVLKEAIKAANDVIFDSLYFSTTF